MGSNLAKLIRASRGPVLLMTLGALLAVNQFTPFSFDQTFPILIIVFGMMWMLERMAPRPMNPTATVTGASMPTIERRQPLVDADRYDPLHEVHRKVYGDAPAYDVKPDPRELPTAEHPIRQQPKPEAKGGTLQ
jgi:hypothetical protein